MKFLYTILTCSVLLLMSGLIVSCGNKGPLYIPSESEPVTQQSFGAQ